MKRVLLLLGALLLTACAGPGGLMQKPEVSLVGVDLLGLGLAEQRFVLSLRVRNPNDADLAISALDFTVELNGLPFAKGAAANAVTVPGRGEAQVQVQASSQLGNVLKQLRELQKRGSERSDYRIVGQVGLAGFGTLPFERRGDMPLRLFDLSPKKSLPPKAEEN